MNLIKKDNINIQKRIKILNLIRLMNKYGYSKASLARKYGCAAAYITRLLNGSGSFGEKTVKKLAVIFDEDEMEFYISSVLNNPSKLLTKKDNINLIDGMISQKINQIKRELSEEIAKAFKEIRAEVISLKNEIEALKNTDAA